MYAIIVGDNERSGVVKKALMALGLLAAMVAAMMIFSGVAHAKTTIGGPTAAQCKNLAIKTIGSSFDPSGYTFVVGTSGDDTFTDTAGKREVFCGFGGNDSMDTIEAGDIFLGGDGNDYAYGNFDGTVYGGAGDDYVYYNQGTFYGEEGNDYVVYPDDSTGTFYQ